MGLLERAKQLAEQAKEQAAGLKNELEERMALGSAGAPVPPSLPLQSNDEATRSARAGYDRAGIPDPASLLSVETISSIVGEQVSGPTYERDAPGEGYWVTWTSPGWVVSITPHVPPQGAATELFAEETMAHLFSNQAREPVGIPGVHEALAVWSPADDEGFVLLRQGRAVLQVGAFCRTGAGPRHQVLRLAQSVAEALT